MFTEHKQETIGQSECRKDVDSVKAGLEKQVNGEGQQRRAIAGSLNCYAINLNRRVPEYALGCERAGEFSPPYLLD